ncbi:hypothetical protein J3Q64DRAFT_1833772 [Phycomyces blakesleeanus]|uniref:Reverse transcriptase zinc-binding domain-containing protein n=2 Tax=Phycomyces blakesleeanus TaxID=4837 RepID=A0A162TYZ3_PHYB8|nr:hypothetical protein PHYBLDRAFT_148173 [Phycomyces blakesleeanus NRRL 1555(-)]OAD70953.1 hypothetical protein PHYBLDRAFT_148173 [Phycomyces blakesleeanus NRRL 1555(-)]|eukprot:XP_018288993.1 hypothetical protein PHYBLDRAFT_148173 [Phycomyces blakesleeanus NRRL 1555(-)]
MKTGWKRLNVSDAFIFDQDLQAIRSRTQTERSRIFFWHATLPPNDHPELLLPVNPLIVDCKPFVGALQTGCKRLSDFTTNRFREACQDHTQSPLVPLPLQAKQWRLFWAFPIHHTSQNIWYWAILNSLSCQYTLHSRAPTIFVTPNCPICLSEVGTLSHFLYQCPQKWTVWETAWIKYFGLSPSTFDIHRALFSLEIPDHPSPVFHVHPCQITSSIILALWRTQWSFIFDNRTFQTSSINSKIDALVSHLSSDLNLT